MNYRVDNLQYCNWSKEIFEINHEAKLDAVHATICYHEDFDELKTNIAQSITQRVSTNDLTESKSILSILYSSFFRQIK